MAKAESPERSITREQQRALRAYEAVGSLPTDEQTQKNYKIAVNALGANILRSGLCAAIAAVQRLNRDSDKRGDILLGHLAGACVPGLEGATASNLAKRVRELDVDGYMIATREMLQVAMWLKRAALATFGDDDHAPSSS